MDSRSLDEIRKDIDEVDSQLVQLLNKRTDLAKEIGIVKGKGQKPFFTPERERAVFESISAISKGPLSPKQLSNIFREIISAARAAEQPMKISFWGPEGTYSHLMAMQLFGASSEYCPAESIEAVFRSLESGEIHYGVVPVENSSAGVVPETLDMFAVSNAKICAEAYLPIVHELLSWAESLDSVKRLYTGQQPLNQCRKWVQANLPQVEIIDTMPTSLATQRALDDKEGAAIGNRFAAEKFGVPILAERIADNTKNRTRFLVIGYNEPAPTGRDKTSFLFNLRNKPGELYRALGILDREGVNLSMIESRPAQNASFEYLFFCDCNGHRHDENVKRAIASLKEYALETILLGSYPASE